MGFTEQEYQDAIAEESRGPQSSGEVSAGVAEVASRPSEKSDSGRESAPSQVQDSGSQAVNAAAAKSAAAAQAKELIELESRKKSLEDLRNCMGGT